MLAPADLGRPSMRHISQKKAWCLVQAEDGIRDLTVTGVQTCALPISVGGGERGAARAAPRLGRRAAAGARRRAGRARAVAFVAVEQGAGRAVGRAAAAGVADAGDRKSGV